MYAALSLQSGLKIHKDGQLPEEDILEHVRTICFLSDFGLADDFVGLCKGAMVRIAPGATIVDLTHEVPGFEVAAGAEMLAHATGYMPENTVYLAVVDPGVGTERRAIALESHSGAYLVGPDNGLLIPAANSLGGVSCAVSLKNDRYHLKPVSSTFHGRDIFSPAAAHLATGIDIEELGHTVSVPSLVSLSLPAVEHEADGTLRTRITAIDRYGNARLSVKQGEPDLSFGEALSVETGEGAIRVRYLETFGASKIGDLALVPDSHRCLSLAINKGNAAQALSLAVGNTVVLKILEPPANGSTEIG